MFELLGLDNYWAFAIMMIFYAFIGWAYESSFFSLGEQGKFMNRGCFMGPYCPIYCVVGALSVILFQNVENDFVLILLAGLVTSIIEYITSYVLEKAFHARYWDYSYFPLNINGRVSVPSGLFFGVGLWFMVRILHPFTIGVIMSWTPTTRFVIGLILAIVFHTDLLITFISMGGGSKRLKKFYDGYNAIIEKGFDAVNRQWAKLDRFRIVKAFKRFVAKLKGLNKQMTNMEDKLMGKAEGERENYKLIYNERHDYEGGAREEKKVEEEKEAEE